MPDFSHHYAVHRSPQLSTRYGFTPEPTPQVTPVEILETAKTILLTEGWTKGNFHENGHHCILGAIEAATWRFPVPNFYLEKEAQQIVLSAIGKGRTPIPWVTIGRWNDQLFRRFKTVIKVLDRAILIAKTAQLVEDEQNR